MTNGQRQDSTAHQCKMLDVHEQHRLLCIHSPHGRGGIPGARLHLFEALSVCTSCRCVTAKVVAEHQGFHLVAKLYYWLRRPGQKVLDVTDALHDSLTHAPCNHCLNVNLLPGPATVVLALEFPTQAPYQQPNFAPAAAFHLILLSSPSYCTYRSMSVKTAHNCCSSPEK